MNRGGWGLFPNMAKSSNSTSSTSNMEGSVAQIVNKDVIEKLQDLTKIISTYKKDNTQALIDDILKYDSTASYDKKIKLPQNVIDKIKTYHIKILKELSNDKKPKDAIKDYYDKNILEFQQKLSQNDDIKNSPEVQKGLSDVLNNIKTIKTNSSFFEYKYMQMNIFMVYFVQKVYILLEKYTEDVAQYMVLQNKYRQNVMIKFMQEIINLLGSEKNVGFSEDDQKQFMDMIDRINVGFENTEKKVRDDLEKMRTGHVNEIAKEILKSDPNANRKNSSTENKNGQQGGMIRDLSILPKKFYDL